MRNYRHLILALFIVLIQSGCTSVDVLNVGGSLTTGEANAGTITYMLGETPVRIVVSGRGQYTFVALHENESTSVAAARAVRAGRLVEIKHGGGREVRFVIGNKRYSIDPNRMFTDAGIRRHLKGGHDAQAISAVKGLAAEVVKRLDRRVVISLHNNTNGGYSIKSYQPGQQYARDAQGVHVSADADPDDFFFATSAKFFRAAQAANFNVALQSSAVTDDGSLSVFCSRQGIPYVNVEAQHGHASVQKSMIEALLR